MNRTTDWEWEPPRHLERCSLLADELTRQGAVVVFFQEPRPPCLIGTLRWTPGRLFVFSANGDRAEDLVAIDFDWVQATGASIHLYRCEVAVASLARIEDAVLDDPEAYRVGWDIWQHIAPLRRELVCELMEEAGGESVVAGQERLTPVRNAAE